MESPVCRWVRANLPAYLDGELKATTAAAVRRHMKRCPACAARARLLADSWELLDESAAPPVRSGFTGRMMERIAKERELIPLQARARSRERLRRFVMGAGGVAAGLLLGFGLYAWSGFEAEPASPVEREVSRSLSFLEDVELLDEIAAVKAIDRLLAEKAGGKEASRG